MNVLVIYHRADFDGLFSREIARKFYGKNAEYLGWDYGDPHPIISVEVREIVMIDISIDGMMDDPRLVWIDHHKSAMDKYNRAIRGYRIDGVAACRLAWQWFFTWNIQRNPTADVCAQLPEKQEFVGRKVSEPYAVRLAGEYDIWDRRDPNVELFQHGLRSRELTDEVWARLLDQGSDDARLISNSAIISHELLKAGTVLQFAKKNENASIAQQQSFTLLFEGLTFCAINAARYNSHLFTAALKPEHDGCLGFNWDGQKRKWKISMYGVPGKPDIDFSKIAVKYGGGGHKQACGFECVTLPFSLGNDYKMQAEAYLLDRNNVAAQLGVARKALQLIATGNPTSVPSLVAHDALSLLPTAATQKAQPEPDSPLNR